MFPTDDDRTTMSLQQAALVRSLVAGNAPPAGFDAVRLLVATRSLARKRARSAARAWPDLAQALGPAFYEHFSQYANSSPLPAIGGPLADGGEFARWLDARQLLSDAGRRQLIAVSLRYRRTKAGLLPRRLPCMRLAWLRESRRVLFGIRLPWLGERWGSCPIPRRVATVY